MSEFGIHHVVVALDDAALAKLVSLAKALGTAPEQLATDAVQSYLRRNDRQAAFTDEGTRALERYRATGLHLTDDEIGAWIAELESGNDDAEPPACHV